jgi:signal transduction histidine kinase
VPPDGERGVREELARLSREQAALRRVAALVARATPPGAVFAAVAEEVAQLLPVADFALLGRYDPDRVVELVGAWSRAGQDQLVGLRFPLGGQNVNTLVFESGQPARVDHLRADRSAGTSAARESGARSSAGAPVSVEGRLWGVMIVASTREDVLPAGIEEHLAGFTELVATAIANTQARAELRGIADEQAALRRVATLVARGTPAQELFFTVTEEAGRLLSVDLSVLARLGPGTETLVAAWSKVGTFGELGHPMRLGGRNVATLVAATGRPARIDHYAEATGEPAVTARGWGLRGCVGVPVTVHGRLWGVMYAASTGEEALPADTEARLANFTDLVATAIANAQARQELTASRARIAATADETRRRIERDLHDGAQQQLVSLALRLRAARDRIPAGLGELGAELDQVAAGLTSTLNELREYARGIHPPVLAQGGLTPALDQLARRSPVPVRLDLAATARLPQRVEVTAYYVVSEALANAAKHANATTVHVSTEIAGRVLRLSVSDDGVGGADPARGSGLTGLNDRVEAAGGTLTVHSQAGQGTRLVAELPADPAEAPGSS